MSSAASYRISHAQTKAYGQALSSVSPLMRGNLHTGKSVIEAHEQRIREAVKGIPQYYIQNLSFLMTGVKFIPTGRDALSRLYALHDPVEDLAAVYQFDENKVLYMAHYQLNEKSCNKQNYHAVWFDAEGKTERFSYRDKSGRFIEAFMDQELPRSVEAVADELRLMTAPTVKETLEAVMHRSPDYKSLEKYL